MLLDYPNHPAGALIQQSVPISLYGTLGLFVFESFASKNDVVFFNVKTYMYVWPEYLTFQFFPFGLAGDEGQALGGSYMEFHWQPDLSPVLKNAGLSRFMITIQSLRLFMCLGQPYSSINFWSFLLWDWPKKCGINSSSMPQIGVWWRCQFDLAKCGKSHPWVHQRIIWPWGGHSWVWRCSSAVRIYIFVFDQNKKGKMSDSYVTIFWWLQTKDAGSLKLHFFLMNFKGGWKYIRQLFTLERNHRTGLGAPAISKPHTAAAILNQILWPYSWFLAHWKPKKWPYIGLCP